MMKKLFMFLLMVTIILGFPLPRGLDVINFNVYGFITKNSYVDVKTYGAKGDGDTDDTVAIQAALNNVDSSGGVVFFPIGEYKITQGLTIKGKTNVKIFGLGKASHIKAYTATFDMLTLSSSSDINIESLFFEGASVVAVKGSGYSAIVILDSPRTSIKKCNFRGTNNGVIIALGNNNCIVSQNIFLSLVGGTSGNGYGVYTVSERAVIKNNTFHNIPRHDVYLSGYDAKSGACFNVVTGNISYGNAVVAITLYATAKQRAVSNNFIKGNTFISAIGHRVIGLTQNSICNVIEGNTFCNSSGVSIFLEGSTTDNTYPDKNIISGNLIYGSSSTLGSIRVINSSYNLIEANQLFNPGSYGILLTTTGIPSVIPTGNVIRNNIVKGSKFNSITSNISDTLSFGNITD